MPHPQVQLSVSPLAGRVADVDGRVTATLRGPAPQTSTRAAAIGGDGAAAAEPAADGHSASAFPLERAVFFRSGESVRFMAAVGLRDVAG